MASEERIIVLERQVAALHESLKGVLQDIGRAAADKGDIHQLQQQIDAINARVHSLEHAVTSRSS